MPAAALFLVAMAVRLLHLWAIRDTAYFDVLMGDARSYDLWAQRLAAGDWIGADVFYQAPLYPYFLGVLYAVFGRDLLMVRLIQAMVGAAAVVLLSSAGERLFSRRVGLAAGLALALYAPAIFFDGLLQKSVLDVFFICLSIWVVSRLVDRPRSAPLWLGLGASMGALSLTRENALALVAVAAAWSLTFAFKTADGRRQTAGLDRKTAPGRRTIRPREWAIGPIARIANPGFRIAMAPGPRVQPWAGPRSVAGGGAELRGDGRLLSHHLAVRPELLHREQPDGGRHLHGAPARTGRAGVRAAGRDRTG